MWEKRSSKKIWSTKLFEKEKYYRIKEILKKKCYLILKKISFEKKSVTKSYTNFFRDKISFGKTLKKKLFEKEERTN